MTQLRIRCLVLALACLTPTAAHAGSRARALETRLLAPCCYTQTLDVHESELATELRHEIERRLAAGDDPQHVEDTLVQRYGERIRAVPRGEDPRGQIPSGVGAVMALALVGLVWLGLRWRRRSEPQVITRDDGYDEALERELSKLE